MPLAAALKGSPLAPGAGVVPVARFFAVEASGGATLNEVLAGLNQQGYWLAPLGYNSHPFIRNGSPQKAPGDYSQTYVGDETDTSPYPDESLRGISTAAFVRNMGVLIRSLDREAGR